MANDTNTAQVTTLPTVAAPKEQKLLVQDTSSFANLLDTAKFEHMWRVARVFSSSKMVPKIFQDHPEDCFVAVQMAVRLEVDPFMFMQNTYPSPDGKPAMEGKLAIALINARGPFKGGVQFRFEGEGDKYGCVAFGLHRDDGQERSLKVDLATVKAEGWYGRNKKWQNMQQQMFMYRAGAWFGRAYCPEVLMGMQTIEEKEDMGQLVRGADGTYSAEPAPARPTRQQFQQPTPEPAEPEFHVFNESGEIVSRHADPAEFALALRAYIQECADGRQLEAAEEYHREAVNLLGDELKIEIATAYDTKLKSLDKKRSA